MSDISPVYLGQMQEFILSLLYFLHWLHLYSHVFVTFSGFFLICTSPGGAFEHLQGANTQIVHPIEVYLLNLLFLA